MNNQVWVPVENPVAAGHCPNCNTEMVLIGRSAYCEKCRQQFKKQKKPVKHRPVVDLTTKDVLEMLTIAGEESPRDFTLLGFMASSLRESEVVGGDGKRVKLPGLQIEDLRLEKEAVWVSGKGIETGNSRKYDQPVPRRFLEAALYLADGRKTGLVPFGVKVRRVNDIVKRYARVIGHPDWRWVRPHHGLRGWFSDAVKKVIPESPAGMVEWVDLMRHSRKGRGVTVGNYGGPSTPFERRREIAVAAMQPLLESLPPRFSFESESTDS